MKIKEGDYIRTSDGHIAKVMFIYTEDKRPDMNRITTTNSINFFYEEIVKVSSNLIDLIEINDMVNGILVSRVEDNRIFFDDEFDYTDCNYLNYIEEDEIKRIVTKEQLKCMEEENEF